MKILAFGDHHGDVYLLEETLSKEQLADAVICLGDMTLFGQDIEKIFEDLNNFKKPLYLIHGNHEHHEDVQTLSEIYENMHYMHKKSTQINEYNFLFYGGDGFSRTDKEFEKVMHELFKNIDPKKTIIILHGPPYNTAIDIPYENHHSGSKSYRKIIEKYQPLLVLAGHIHEGEHQSDLIGKTFVLNPGPDGEVIDLKILYGERLKLEKEFKK